MVRIDGPTRTDPFASPFSPRAVSVPLSASAFLSREEAARVAAESMQVANSVAGYARAADVRAVDIAALEVTDYSTTARGLSHAASGSFFTQNQVADPAGVVDRSRAAGQVKMSADIAFDRDGSLLDAFSVRLSIQFGSTVRAVSIMRRDDGNDQLSQPMSRRGLSMISSFESDFTGRGATADVEVRVREAGLATRIDLANPVDPFVGTTRDSMSRDVRLFVSQTEVQSSLAVSALAGIIAAATASRMDMSLIYDLNTIERMRAVFPTGSRAVVVSTPPKELQHTRTESGFQQIALLGVTTGNPSLQFNDSSVIRGRRYSYYAAIVSDDGTIVGRSEIIPVIVDRIASPVPTPLVVANIGENRIVISVRCDERAESLEVYRQSGGPREFAGTVAVVRGETIFIDSAVVPSRYYTYHVYAVDCFSNKSQTPAVCSVFTDVHNRVGYPRTPIVSADVDALSGLAFVDITVEDPAIRAAFVYKRDLSISEVAYSNIGAPNISSIGVFDNKRSHLASPIDPSSLANGFIPTPAPGVYRYVDLSSRVDHTYQYGVVAIDQEGRRSHHAQTHNIFVSKRPLVSPPFHLSASVDGVTIRLSWIEPNLTKTVADMLGDREKLAATSVRNLYQLQRMEIRKGTWDSFPLVDTQYLVDGRDDETDGRPPPPVVGDTYLYRVATFQTGGYYSNFTDPVRVAISVPPPAPGPLKVECSDIRVSPIRVIVAWGSPSFDGEWVIERAQVSQTEKVRSVDAANRLSYGVVGRITRESSRGSPRDIDRDRSTAIPKLHNRAFFDKDVKPGLTYFYRVTAVKGEMRSTPSVGAISLARTK